MACRLVYCLLEGNPDPTLSAAADIPPRYPTSISNLDIPPVIISHLGEKRMVGVDKTAYCSNRCYWLNIVEVLNIVELKSMLSDIYWAQAAAKTLHWLLCKSVYFCVILVILVSQNREQCCSSSAPTGWFSDSSNTSFCTGGSNLGLHLQWGLRWGPCNTQYIIHCTLYIMQ